MNALPKIDLSQSLTKRVKLVIAKRRELDSQAEEATSGWES